MLAKSRRTPGEAGISSQSLRDILRRASTTTINAEHAEHAEHAEKLSTTEETEDTEEKRDSRRRRKVALVAFYFLAVRSS